MKRTIIALAAMGLGTMAHAVSFNISNDFTGWLASVGPNPTLGTGTFIPDPGNPTNPVLSGLPGVSFATGGSGSSSVAYNSPNLTSTVTSGGWLEWTFSTPQNGWGGNFDIPSASNTGLQFQACSTFCADVDFFSAGQGYTGFYGFSSATPFTKVLVIGTGPLSSYNMADVSIAAVPEPSSYAMMVAGLLALVGLSARRKERKG